MEPVPEQDVRFGDPASPPTAWSDVRRVLETAELFWVSTVRRDGRPHVTPLPAVWTDDCLHFCTGAAEQKAVNLVGNPEVVLTTGGNQWKHGLDEDGGTALVFKVAPTKVLAFAKGEFAQTRYRFAQPPGR